MGVLQIRDLMQGATSQKLEHVHAASNFWGTCLSTGCAAEEGAVVVIGTVP